MPTPLQTLIASGTKLWLDSIDPELVAINRKLGATGATSNPVIVSNLIKTGRFDDSLVKLMQSGKDDDAVAWAVTDQLVSNAESVFLPVWNNTKGDDGYVSFELDPLLEDPGRNIPHAERVSRYIELGKKWAADHPNRMIKVPATPAGIDALEELCAAGVTLNVTLIFSARQYRAAREAVWRGAQRRQSLAAFKSVYSIFVSRLDVYTEKAVPELSPAAQGQVGIVNAKHIWQENEQFWQANRTPLRQEIIFASTGVKSEKLKPYLYVQALAGSDIQTNPPETNDAAERSGVVFSRQVDHLPPPAVLDEIARLVDQQQLEETLMREGIQKFADPQKALLKLVADKRASLAATH